MITRRQISHAIMVNFNMDVEVAGEPGEGCYHFYSNDPATQLMLSSWYSTTVYVNSLNQWSLSQWTSEFRGMLQEAEKTGRPVNPITK